MPFCCNQIRSIDIHLVQKYKKGRKIFSDQLYWISNLLLQKTGVPQHTWLTELWPCMCLVVLEFCLQTKVHILVISGKIILLSCSVKLLDRIVAPKTIRIFSFHEWCQVVYHSKLALSG